MGNNVKSRMIQEGEFLQFATRFHVIRYDTDRHHLQVRDRKTKHEYIFK